MTTLLSKVLVLAMAKYTKSPVDSKIELAEDGTESDTEIEFSNYDEEGDVEPEYDVSDSEVQE